MKTGQPYDFAKPVLVTGGAGYIGSWVIKMLLEAGVHVRTTVRDKSNKTKVQHLESIGKRSSGKLDLFEADLLEKGSFGDAMEGCGVVFHVASPFPVGNIKDPEKTVVQPALEGTRNVLGTVNDTKTVDRVVLTSSVAAIYGDSIDIQKTERGVFTEEHWNKTSSISHNPYYYSKTVAEKEAWRIVKDQDEWDLVVLNPGFVMGPSLSKRTDSTSNDFLRSMLRGKFKSGVPSLNVGFVDVRDVAQAHLLAANSPKASGRHLLVSETLGFIDIGKILRLNYGRKFKLPKRIVPKSMTYLLGPIMAGLSLKFISNNIGIPIRIDNSYSKQDLGIEYTSMKKTLIDHAEQLIADGLI